MRRTFVLLLTVVSAVFLFSGVAFTQTQGASDSARYIVVLKDGVDSPGQVANGLSKRNNMDVGYVYSHAIKGFSATIPDQRLDNVRSADKVDYVEHDGTMKVTAQVLPWGIDRIDADVSSTLAGNGSGTVTGVRAYIIDTGIDAGHTDLTVAQNVNFAGGPNTDCNGHGTHVAGTVGAEDNAQDVVGVAPGVSLTGVKVLGCSGSGSTSGVIKGVDWVTANAQKPAVANMSLGGSVSKALDDAVTKSANNGVFYSLAAGNESQDACNTSPARAGAGTNNGIMTIAATDNNEQEASFSNYGKCVDIWAPGVSILSTKKGGGTTTLSGTSMASPHVGGTGALYLSLHATASPSTVESDIKANAQLTGTKSEDERPILRLYAGAF